MNTVPQTYNGIEIDMLTLGDADCLVVTQRVGSQLYRVLIDGGSGGNYEQVVQFLQERGFTSFTSVVCTHAHEDHAAGLIKLVNNKAFTFYAGWMHDIRNHISKDDLRSASAASDGVKQVVETTRELVSAFSSRNIVPNEPFTGSVIAHQLQVLGPAPDYYKSALAEFTDIAMPIPAGLSALASLLGSGTTPYPAWASLSGNTVPSSSLYAGALAKSSVQEDPETQPYNNTSVVLGLKYGTVKCLLTADAGSEALDRVPDEWCALDWMQVPHHGSDGNLSQKNIERFRPRVACISAKGDTSHPSQAIVNGLIKLGSTVYSTHYPNPTNLWYRTGGRRAKS